MYASSPSRFAYLVASILEQFFRTYLQQLVQSSAQPLRLVYECPGGMGIKHTFVSQGNVVVDEADLAAADVHIRVLAPNFYTRFVHYSHTREAFDREGLAVGEKSRTLVVGNPALLYSLLDSSTKTVSLDKTGSKTGQKSGLGVVERLRWLLLEKIRCPPPAAAYPSSDSGKNNVVVEDIRSLPLSELDRFVQQHCEDRNVYRNTTTRLFLAERYAGGFAAVLGLGDLLLRAAMVAVAVAARTAAPLIAVNLWSVVKGL